MDETVPVEEDLEIHEKRNAEFAIMDRAMKSFSSSWKSVLEWAIGNPPRGLVIRVTLF